MALGASASGRCLQVKLLKEEDGQSLVLFAAVMGIVALGFLAFGLDIETLFRQERLAQSAADAAALAAATEISNNASANEQAPPTQKGFGKTNGEMHRRHRVCHGVSDTRFV